MHSEHNQDLPQNTKYKTKDNRTKIHDCLERLVNPSEKVLATGPTTKNVNGTVMSNVKKGTTKTLMTSGVILVKNF